ncbi:MAG: hypothetical protein O9353_13300, partial [Bacteroidia bacterium]|nr:hypothetical protein [Bacteroidia bacterium]
DVLAPATSTTGVSSVISSSICLGQSTVITPSGAAGYSITPGNTTGTSFTLSPAISTTYTITALATGCNSSTTIASVFVDPTPSFSNTSIGICSGQTATLTSSAAAGYTWSPSGATTQSISVQPVVSTNYMVMGNNGVCTFTRVTSVSVTPTPALAINHATVCAGQTATLTASGANAYVWQPAGASGPVFNAQPLANTSYTVTGSNGVCTSSAVASVSVIPTPVLSVSSATICGGQTTTLTASSTSGYTWSPSGANTPAISVQPATTSVYTVSSSNGNCTSTSLATVFVMPTPVVSVSSQNICPGQTATLTASGASSYTWLPSGQTGSILPVQPGSTTIYTITGSKGLCATTSTTAVNVIPPPENAAAGAS